MRIEIGIVRHCGRDARHPSSLEPNVGAPCRSSRSIPSGRSRRRTTGHPQGPGSYLTDRIALGSASAGCSTVPRASCRAKPPDAKRRVRRPRRWRFDQSGNLIGIGVVLGSGVRPVKPWCDHR